MKKYQLIFVFILIGSQNCGWIDRYHAQELRKYFLQFIQPYEIRIEEISCEMNPPRSRTGYLLFKISREEFNRMKQILNLKELPVEPNKNGFNIVLSILWKYPDVKRFKFKNLNFIPEDSSKWKQSPLLKDVKIYQADPPLAPMKGNSRSSFLFLLFNSSTQECCAFLEYPYS